MKLILLMILKIQIIMTYKLKLIFKKNQVLMLIKKKKLKLIILNKLKYNLNQMILIFCKNYKNLNKNKNLFKRFKLKNLEHFYLLLQKKETHKLNIIKKKRMMILCKYNIISKKLFKRIIKFNSNKIRHKILQIQISLLMIKIKQRIKLKMV